MFSIDEGTAFGARAAAHLRDAYTKKYEQAIPGIGETPESFAVKYSTGFTIELTALRGH